MDDVLMMGVIFVVAIVVIAVAFLAMRNKGVEDNGKKVSDEQLIEKMNLILRYKNEDRF